MTDMSTNAPRPAALIFDTENTSRTRTVVETPQELRPAEGMFTVECPLGTRTFARLTGRTRRFWGMACPTVERYEVETVVIDGALWGVPGARIPGTFAVRPDAF